MYHREDFITQTSLPKYKKYKALCSVSNFFGMICCLFSNCSKRFRPYVWSLTWLVNLPRSYVPEILAVQWSKELRHAFISEKVCVHSLLLYSKTCLFIHTVQRWKDQIVKWYLLLIACMFTKFYGYIAVAASSNKHYIQQKPWSIFCEPCIPRGDLTIKNAANDIV